MANKKVKKFKMPRTPATKSKALEENTDVKDKIFSFEHVRKYHDNILFGTSQRNVISCDSYCVEMRKFLNNYKKEVAYGKKNDLIDENSTEPFTFPLHVKLSMWFLENGMMFGWIFLTLLWNFMAR